MAKRIFQSREQCTNRAKQLSVGRCYALTLLAISISLASVGRRYALTLFLHLQAKGVRSQIEPTNSRSTHLAAADPLHLGGSVLRADAFPPSPSERRTITDRTHQQQKSNFAAADSLRLGGSALCADAFPPSPSERRSIPDRTHQ